MGQMIGVIGLWAVLAGSGGLGDVRQLEFGKEYEQRHLLGTGEYLYIKFIVADGGTPSQLEFDVCSNKCNGGKHAKHSDCDASCDDACNPRKDHRPYLEPKFI